MKSIAPSLMLTAAIGIAGCGSDTPEIVEQADTWFNAYTATGIEPEVVPASAVYPVAPERLAEAGKVLEEIAISQISPGEAEYFAGRPVDMPDVTRPFLVRGLYRTKPSFSVRIVGNALWVASHDDPADSAPMRRQPLLLIMEEVPELIYVTTAQ